MVYRWYLKLALRLFIVEGFVTKLKKHFLFQRRNIFTSVFD